MTTITKLHLNWNDYDIGSEQNVKIFTLTGTTWSENLDVATQAYTHAYVNGGLSIIRYSWYNYVYMLGGGSAADFVSTRGGGNINSGTWNTSRTLVLSVSSWAVTAITERVNKINISSSTPTTATNDIITLVI